MAIKFAFVPLLTAWNHGIALLSALCKNRGIDVSLSLLKDPSIFEREVMEFQGQYVGFSCVCNEDYIRSLPFFKIAKNAGKTVILGGVWASRGLPVSLDVDLVCRGDGEALPDFILSGDDSLFKTKHFCSDIESLPLPDYEIFEGYPFDRGFPIFKDKKVLPYVSSRGCPHRCTFCLIQDQPKGVRVRRKMGEELMLLKNKYDPDIFFLGDTLLPYYDTKWCKSWGEFRHPFVAYIRADIYKHHLLWLIDRGMVGCAFGVESGDESFRNDILKKKLTDKQLFETVDILKYHNIGYVPFYMTGIPGENFTMRTKTHDLISKVGGWPMVWPYEPLDVGSN